MSRLYLALVLHNHQPVGNYGFVIERVYEEAYAPMLDALERHPHVRVAMHTSGCLFDWIERHRPAYIERLRALCERGQVEMLTGGYYEPVLPMIPDRDKLGQIRKLSRYVEDRFAQTPRGMWLTERVWEPGLPAPLAEAGVQWTLVDDAHFLMTGMREEDLDGPYLTEDQGRRLLLFPGSKRLRYAIPWSPVGDLLAELHRYADDARRPHPLLVLGDDGEKFGAWPTTYSHVWQDGWIDAFFAALDREGDWIETITPGDYASRFPPRGLTYLPAASYAEMMEWAMPPDAAAAYRRITHELESQDRHDFLGYLRGGFWRFFLARYPEANAMHKRGLRIGARLERRHNPEAQDALWAAQCNCPYWHGVFGGLYLRHIRSATLANLVRAERLAAPRAPRVTVTQADFDYDGQQELFVQSPFMSLLLHAGAGGILSELDFRRRDHALLNVIARRRESYHDALLAGEAVHAGDDTANIHGALRVTQPGLEQSVAFDQHRRAGFQEWLLAPDAAVRAFAVGDAAVVVAPEGEWTREIAATPRAVTVDLERSVAGWRLRKRLLLTLADEAVSVSYELTNLAGERRAARFLSEWNVSPPHAPQGDDRIARLSAAGTDHDAATDPGSVDAVASFTVHGTADWHIAFDLADGAPCDVWYFPVNTVSSSEGGLELVYQGVSVSVARLLDLAPGESTVIAFTIAAR